MHNVIRLILANLGMLGLVVGIAACGTTSATEDAAGSDATAQDGADLDAAETGSDAVTATDAVDAAVDATPVDIQALCLQASPNPVVFAPTASGAAAMAKFELQNCGLQGVCITGIDLQNETAYLGEYNLAMSGMKTLCPTVDATKGPSVTNPCCLAKGSSVALEVYFTPKYYSASNKTAQVWVNSNVGKTIVLLEGMATK